MNTSTKVIYTATGETARLSEVRLDKGSNRYSVHLYINGDYQPEADYYTSDLRDATDTADCMVDVDLFNALCAIRNKD